MVFERILLVAVAAGLLTVATACSDDPKNVASAKKDAATACEHINSVCASKQGMQKLDCSSSNAAYEKLTASEKRQADGIAACVMAAKTCDPALDCTRTPESKNDSPARSTSTTHNTEDACEHINQVCESKEGFRTQDCSSSRADYAKLSDADKRIADSITPCIIDAETCDAAFECLNFE